MDLPPPYAEHEAQDRSYCQLPAIPAFSSLLFEPGQFQKYFDDIEAAVSAVSLPPYPRVDQSYVTGCHSNCEMLEWIDLDALRRGKRLECHQMLEETLRRLRLAGTESTPEWAMENQVRSQERLRAFALYTLADEYDLNDMVHLLVEEHRHFVVISALWFLYRRCYSWHTDGEDKRRAPFRAVFNTMLFWPAEALGIPLLDMQFLIFREVLNILERRQKGERHQERSSKSFVQKFIQKEPPHHWRKLTWEMTTAKALIPTSHDLWPALSSAIRNEASLYFPHKRFDPVPVRKGEALSADISVDPADDCAAGTASDLPVPALNPVAGTAADLASKRGGFIARC